MFDGVTFDWCEHFKFNKIVALDIAKTLELFQRKSIIAIWGDFIYQDDIISQLLTYYNRAGIPLYIFIVLY